jgi:hypothetical protein
VGAREASQALPERFVPVDHAIVGIVDEIELMAQHKEFRLPAERWKKL